MWRRAPCVALAAALACGSGTRAGMPFATDAAESAGEGSGAAAGSATAGTTHDAETSGTTRAASQGTAATTATASTASTASTSSSDGADTTAGFRFDVGDGTTTTNPQQGCQKVDFLFVIDNSASMIDEQQRLVDAFPGFIAAIRAEVAGTDHHLMVVDSDEHAGWFCEQFGMPPACSGGANPLCDAYPCGTFPSDTCGETLGAGVRESYGGYARNADCGLPVGQRYMVGSDAMLEDQFACAATVGASGNSAERPMSAAVAALENSDGCNDGFLRDDALLVLTVITDDERFAMTDDDANASNAVIDGWVDAILAVKGGDPANLVVLGLVPYDQLGCTVFRQENKGFIRFVEGFGSSGILASVCDPDYASLFSDVVADIDVACDNFDPPG